MTLRGRGDLEFLKEYGSFSERVGRGLDFRGAGKITLPIRNLFRSWNVGRSSNETTTFSFRLSRGDCY